MKQIINVPTHGGSTPVPAIIRGELALHVAVRTDGRRQNEWSVTHVPTGRQIIIIRGAYAGRAAFRMLGDVSFETVDKKLMRKCNKVVAALRKRGLVTLFPRYKFTKVLI